MSNDFLVFGGGAGANVVTQAAWAALAQRLSGFTSGVAQSAQLNKAWRQSSIMAAVIGQFISDQSGQDALDDGTTATLVANLLTGIRAANKTQITLVDTGAANAYTATNAPALLAGTWVDGVTQRVKITNANTGASTYSPDGLTAVPIYGLNLSALQGGELRANCVATFVKATVPGVNSGNPVAVLVHCYGAPLQVAAPSNSNHAVNLAAGDARYAALAGLVSQVFSVASPTAAGHATPLSEFPASLAINGYVKIPVYAGGVKRILVIQWGTVAGVAAGGGSNITYPIAFPTAVLIVMGTIKNSGGVSTALSAGVGIESSTGMTVFNNGNSGAAAINWTAIGY